MRAVSFVSLHVTQFCSPESVVGELYTLEHGLGVCIPCVVEARILTDRDGSLMVE
jgi:hypothetical protein